MRCFPTLVLAGLTLAGIAGCGGPALNSQPELARAAPLESRRAHEPELKQTHEVNVGEVMYSEFVYQRGSAAQLIDAAYSKNVLLGEVKLTAETLLEKQEAADYPTYCSTDKVYYSFTEETPSDIACFTDEEGDGWFDRVRVPGIKFGTWTKTEDGPRYRIQTVERRGSERQELLYQGLAGNTLKLAYREYDRQGEPGASQRVEYTLSAEGAPTPIGFKQARLMIDSADNTRIRYRVLRGFEEK